MESKDDLHVFDWTIEETKGANTWHTSPEKVLGHLRASTTAKNNAISLGNNTTTFAPKPKPSSYRTIPVDVKVGLGEPAEFRCGVSEGSQNLIFTFYSSHGNYTLTCPNGKMEDISQALYGSCEVKNGELVAIWTLKGTSYSDNNARVVCQQSNNPDECVAVLHVYGADDTEDDLDGIVKE
ncbi:hypothetical protein CRENBAI_003585 [Crenichthys baileyi]|uniref:Uncharacterized protein n=1 Tax=Crenichthys baileyi TaxID=28760 RepID=A0AAV9SM01_9TELE